MNVKNVTQSNLSQYPTISVSEIACSTDFIYRVSHLLADWASSTFILSFSLSALADVLLTELAGQDGGTLRSSQPNQGPPKSDHSACSKPLVDIDLKVAF